MDLSTIAARSRIEARRLRYALEYRLVPNASKPSKGRGTRRQFSDPEAFLLALAGLMLESGMRRPMVKLVTTDLSSFFRAEMGSLDFELTLGDPGKSFVIEIADGVNRRAGSANPPSGPWIQMKTGEKIDSGYKPLALIRFDIAELGRRLFAEPIK